jgi:hypothetical protein
MGRPFLLALLLHGTPTLEQARETATELVRDALAAFEKGEYTKAAERYLEAHQVAAKHGLPPKPELLYNAGLAYDLAGRCDRAAQLLESYHRAPKESSPDDLEDRLARAKACAPPVRVETTPRSASVLVDGELRGTTPLELRLLQGQRRVRFELEGYVALEETWVVPENGLEEMRRLEVRPDRGELEIETTTSTVILDGRPVQAGRIHALPVGRHAIRFERSGCAPRAEELLIEAQEAKLIGPGPCVALQTEIDRPLSISPWAWVGAGVGAAGLAGGIALSLLANGAVDRRDAELAKSEDAISGRIVREEHDEAVRLSIGAYVAFGVAAGAGVLALILFLGGSE